jgi:hypothetical protein
MLHARRPHWLYGGSAIPGHCHLAGPPPGGRTGFTAAVPSLATATLPGLRPAAAPPGGRVRALFWRAAVVQTNLRSGGAMPRRSGKGVASGFRGPEARGYTRWTARGCPCQSSGVDSERRQDAGSELASSDRRAGCPSGASGEMARATPSLRHPRRPSRWHRQSRACVTHDVSRFERRSLAGVFCSACQLLISRTAVTSRLS